MSTPLWDVETLNKLRQVMDTNADSAVASIYSSQSSELLRNTLMQIASNDSLALKEHFTAVRAPEPLFDLINSELSREFSDTDIAMFKRAHEVWMDNGISFIYVLFFRALPFTYAAEKPANVLRMTRLIEEQATRRIFETAQFVFDVMDSNWWEPDKRGIITAVKIRIMHAAMRHMLLKNEGDEKWNGAEWGMPISQEDLIATNQVFSLEFFKGMTMLGLQMSPDDQDAWFHTWKVIGSIMGIEDNLLLPAIPEAWELQTAVYTHLFNDVHPSGIGLAKALVEALAKFMLPEKLTLIMMHKMMKDDGFPDIFNKLLGPTYSVTYANLFGGAVDDKALGEKINDDFFDELKNFHDAVKDYRDKEIAAKQVTNDAAPDKNLVDFQLEEFRKIFGDVKKIGLPEELKEDIEKAEIKIVDEIEKIFHHTDNTQSKPGLRQDVAKVKEEIAVRAMNAIGKVIIDVLSKYFRAGKNAGFRIDANLKEHWSLK